MTDTLGQLANIAVRELWPNEAADFTPWLARDENMSKLGGALGLELETDRVEVAVGPYSADILARDSAGDYVVIENQLNKTDHDHLGKSITYASVLGARAVIWVAPFFTDEHRKALDWLNDNTTDELAFYGVQVELWSIDGSKPAVRFNAVSRPAEIIRLGSRDQVRRTLVHAPVAARLVDSVSRRIVDQQSCRFWSDPSAAVLV